MSTVFPLFYPPASEGLTQLLVHFMRSNDDTTKSGHQEFRLEIEKGSFGNFARKLSGYDSDMIFLVPQTIDVKNDFLRFLLFL